VTQLSDLHDLPKYQDSLSFIYLEHGRLEQSQSAVMFADCQGEHHIPAAAVNAFLLGPGSAVTHAAVSRLAENNALLLFMGDGGLRFSALGLGATRDSGALIRQAALVSDQRRRLDCAARMYRMRFAEAPDALLSIEQLRGLEGQRVRKAYQQASERWGVRWQGRSYDRSSWSLSDPVNRALSCANACLYGLCHAAIVSLGYSPGLGVIHSGKQLSFVYDIGDLYKTELTIPISFRLAAGHSGPGLEKEVRVACRYEFWKARLLARIVRDIQAALGEERRVEAVFAPDSDPALPTPLWDPDPFQAAPPPLRHDEEDIWLS
jgi:CRISP-associated protein Cas1